MSSGNLKSILEEVLVLAVSPVLHHGHASLVVHRQDQPAQESRDLAKNKTEILKRREANATTGARSARKHNATGRMWMD